MQSKIDNNLTVLEKKILFTLDDQNSVFEYMIKYIDQKTYGSYRTVSKNIKKAAAKFLEDKFITRDEYDKIFEAIKNKTTSKKPVINFNLDKYYENYLNSLKIKNNDSDLLDYLFLSLPFLYVPNSKELTKIKISKIDIFKVSSGLIIRWENSKDEISSLLMCKYDELWLNKFEILKKLSTNDLLFYKFSLSNNVQSYTKLNLDLHELLDDFISNKSSKLKYITEIKNALKYSENSIFRLI